MEIIKTAKTIDEAVAQALAELNCKRDEVTITVLEQPSSRLFGFIQKPAKISVVKNKVSDDKASVEVELGNAHKKLEPAAIENSALQPREILEEVLSEIIGAFGLNVTFTIEENLPVLEVELSGDVGLLIGRRGTVLDALGLVLSTAVNRHFEEKYFVRLDAASYRAKRKAALEKLAASCAARAVRLGKPVRLEPMNRAERRIIHEALQSNPKVQTSSQGNEPYRYVVVSVSS